MMSFVNVFTVTPKHQQEALRRIQQVYTEVVRHQPGFLGARLLVSDDGVRVTAVAQWQSAADLQAMRHTPRFHELHDEGFFNAVLSNDGHVYSISVDIGRPEETQNDQTAHP